MPSWCFRAEVGEGEHQLCIGTAQALVQAQAVLISLCRGIGGLLAG